MGVVLGLCETEMERKRKKEGSGCSDREKMREIDERLEIETTTCQRKEWMREKKQAGCEPLDVNGGVDLYFLFSKFFYICGRL